MRKEGHGAKSLREGGGGGQVLPSAFFLYHRCVPAIGAGLQHMVVACTLGLYYLLHYL